MSEEEVHVYFERLMCSENMRLSIPDYDIHSDTGEVINLRERARKAVQKKIGPSIDLASRYANLNYAFENTMALFIEAKKEGNIEMAETYEKEAKQYAELMVTVRQEACLHEFIKGQDKCCRCGVAKTEELEKCAKERNLVKVRNSR